MGKYNSSNAIRLSASQFNILLSAIVDSKGAKEGMKMWDLFCEDPRDAASPERAHRFGDFLVQQDTRGDDDSWETGYFLRAKADRPPTHGEHIPIIKLKDVESPMGTVNIESSDDLGWAAPPTSEISFAVPELGRGNQMLGFESSPAMTLDSPPSLESINPIVVPDLRTLRIIVRGAIAEHRTRQAQGRSTNEQNKILRWAIQFYRAFGASKEMIELEIQQPLVDNKTDGLSMQEAKALYDEHRRTMGHRERRKVDVSKTFARVGMIGK